MDAKRRYLLKASLALAASGAVPCVGAALKPAPLTAWLKHPLLVQTLYRHSVTNHYDLNGAAGANLGGYRWIEEQRQGAEWIVRAYAQGNAEWSALGWLEFDWGLAHQQPDGGFASEDPFHSTSFFVEALARGCLIEPHEATAPRLLGLKRAAGWLMSPDAEAQGVAHNRPYTHRRYILAAAFGQSAAVLSDARFADKALMWLDEGLAMQLPDGTNPEKGGFDAGYQMVGVLMALRYLPNCMDQPAREGIASMVRLAIGRELLQLRPDGSIDASGSTRIEKEFARGGNLKEVPYGEIVQALVYAAQAYDQPTLLDPAEKIAAARRW